jgi:hypothetical protein
MSFRTGRDHVVPCWLALDPTDRMQLQTDRMQLHLLQILPLSAWRFSMSLSPRCSNFASANQNILAVFNADFIPFRLPPLRFRFTVSSNCAQLFHVPHHNASPLHPESNPTTKPHDLHSISYLPFHLLTNLTSHYELSHRTRSRRSVLVCSRCD